MVGTIPANVEYYTGFWINWAYGRVAGATLTLSLQQGSYVIAFLALYISLVSNHVWQIISYFAFRTKASPSKTDVLYKHQLLVLRNVPTDFTAAIDLAKAAWKERHHGKKVIARSALLISAAIIHGLAFAAAGILASRVTSAASDVLLRSDVCGIWPALAWNATHVSAVESIQAASSSFDSVITSMHFVAECFSNTSQANCNSYGRKLSDFHTSTSSKCPFDPVMCTHDLVLRLDSGLVDSLYDLGINTHPSDRVAFRKILECSPIKSDGFTKTYTAFNGSEAISGWDDAQVPESMDGSKFTAFYYGPSQWIPIEPTFVFDNSSFDISSASIPLPYLVHTEAAFPADESSPWSSFRPIPQLSRSSGAVILLFLASQAIYTSPVEDPWFQASAKMPIDSPLTEAAFVTYESRPQVSVLGCTAQTSVCNPVTGGPDNCVPYYHGSDATAVTQRLGLGPVQADVWSRFQDPLSTEIDMILSAVTSTGLLAFQHTDPPFSPGLPNDQWILELQNLFSILLTSIQLNVVKYVTGAQNPAYNRYFQPPAPDAEWMCDNQITQRSDHASLSVLGLAIILVLGGLIMITNAALSTLWPILRPDTALAEYRDLQWEANEFLELQPKTMEDAKKSRDEKSRRSSITSSSKDGLLSTMKTTGPKSWQRTDSSSQISVRRDEVSGRSASHATIDMSLQHGDFPPRELSNLFAESI